MNFTLIHITIRFFKNKKQSKWKRINRKQITRWQHLFWLTVSEIH